MTRKKNTTAKVTRKNNSLGCFAIIAVLVLGLCSQLGQSLNILPDAQEQTQTRVAQNATRQQRTAVSSDQRVTSTATAAPTNTIRPTRVFPTAVDVRTDTGMQVSRTEVAADNLIAMQTNSAMSNKTYYASGNANLRKCAGTAGECVVVGTIPIGYELAITGEEEGQAVAGSTLWYIIEYEKQIAYIHSSLVTDRKPVVQATTRPQTNNSGSAQTAPTNAPAVEQPTTPPLVAATSTPMPQPAFTCGGDLYNCSDFRNRAELMEYFNRCPGDPSRLDQNNDGVPCESLG